MLKHLTSGAPNKDRGRLLRTGLLLIRYLRDGKRTYKDIAGEFGTCVKTVKRMLKSVEDAGVPLVFELDEAEIPLRGGSPSYRVGIDRRWKL